MKEVEELNPVFEFGKLKPTDLIKEAEDISNESDNIGIFKVKGVNKWVEEAKNQPTPRMLFGELWHEKEVCILFADTNLGKSILSVQLGNSISKGEQIRGFKLGVPKQCLQY